MIYKVSKFLLYSQYANRNTIYICENFKTTKTSKFLKVEQR